MKSPTIRLAALLVSFLLPALPAHALFRAYLSVGGNDANPCTVQMPCRLLPAALAAVSDGGEIWMVDSANYNTATVSVTKSVSILAVPGQVASLVSTGGGPALTINTAGVTVALRNLVFVPVAGASAGNGGVSMGDGALLSVEGCLFANLAGHGIDVGNSAAHVRVGNTVFRNLASGAAVYVANGPNVDVSSSRLVDVYGGLVVTNNAAATLTALAVTDVVIAGGTEGISAISTGSTSVSSATVTRTTIQGTGEALHAEIASGLAAGIIISYSTVSSSATRDIFVSGGLGASILSMKNNYIESSGSDVGSITPGTMN
jgi:hypothetical protein